MQPPTAIMETAIYVNDLEAAEAFYCDVFGLEIIRKVPGSFVFFRCGRQVLLVFDPEKSRKADPDNPI
ncbi:MAG TPA: lactoylglutathione lyase, partial [Agrobacterium sp.]|nr:lactoylglutathione lyase [Agrobacterium sp.]